MNPSACWADRSWMPSWSNSQPVASRYWWMYRAMSPVPTNPIRRGRPCGLSRSAARTAEAAVLDALMMELSRQANG